MDGTAAPLSDVFFNRQVENVDARGTDDSERERERESLSEGQARERGGEKAILQNFGCPNLQSVLG